jgi:hypothetical protein
VYILNALYLGPLTLWTYWKYGRPTLPEDAEGDHAKLHNAHDNTEDTEKSSGAVEPHSGHNMSGHAAHEHHMEEGATTEVDHSKMQHGKMDHSPTKHDTKEGHMSHAQMHGGGDRPMFATVTIAVCHCGTGCLLGDLIGEWIVFGANTTINGRGIWVEFLLGASRLHTD